MSEEIVNLDYFIRRKDFVEHKRRVSDFRIMYNTYHGTNPTEEEINDYSIEINGLSRRFQNIEEDDDDEWSEDEDRWDED